jgi:chaperonin cofactor prefoldin
MDIMTDEEKKQMKQRIRLAASIAGSPFLFHRFKRGEDHIIECKEVDADSIMYFCKGDSIYNAYKKQLKADFKKEMDTLVADGWEFLHN